jgi:hypothetical protein
MRAFSRRALLRDLGPAAAFLLGPLLRQEARAAAGRAAPKRVLVLQFPNGRARDTWKASGTERAFQLGRAVAPLEPLRSDLVVVEGLDVPWNRVGEAHGAALVGLMTGAAVKLRNAGDNYTHMATRPSIDQILSGHAPLVEGSRFKTLQVAADVATQAHYVSGRTLGWGAGSSPIPPEHVPAELYKRIFGGMLTPSADGAAELARVRAERGSVLDFLKRDWGRLHSAAPASQRTKLESHMDAIRQLEQDLDALPPVTQLCREPSELKERLPKPAPSLTKDDYQTTAESAHHEQIGKAQLEMLRIALACDVTRIANFMWAPSIAKVNFYKQVKVEGMFNSAYHQHSHANIGAAKERSVATGITAWYNERVAAFIKTLKETPDGAGTLLDNMLVVYASELADGPSHSMTDIPVVLFGKLGGALKTGRFVSHPKRNVNDLWIAVAQACGLPLQSFGDPERCRGALPGLFG